MLEKVLSFKENRLPSFMSNGDVFLFAKSGLFQVVRVSPNIQSYCTGMFILHLNINSFNTYGDKLLAYLSRVYKKKPQVLVIS